MAKTLSERIADRVRQEKTSVGAQNRAAFLALRSEIAQALDDGWLMRKVWGQLQEEGKISFSYQTFRLLVKSLILDPKKRSTPKAGTGEKPLSNQANVEKETVPVEKETVPAPPPPSMPKKDPSKPPAPTGFNFDAKPKKEDYL